MSMFSRYAGIGWLITWVGAILVLAGVHAPDAASPVGATGFPGAMSVPAVWGSPEFEDNFATLAPRGSFLARYARWNGYPTSYHTTDYSGYYDPDQVSVVSATDNGRAVHAMDVLCTPGAPGKNVSAVMYPKGNLAKHAGMLVEERIRVLHGTEGWHIANLLWPSSGNWPHDGEIDYYETEANDASVNIFTHHYDGTSPYSDQEWGASLNQSQWHTVAMAWMPGQYINWYVDGKLKAHVTTAIEPASDPMGLALQIESDSVTDGGVAPGHSTDVQYNWIRVYYPE